MTDRKNLKVAKDTFELLREHKRDMETWDSMFRRLVKHAMHDRFANADDDQAYIIKERVPYVDEPEIREHEASSPVEASNIVAQIESPQVGSEVVNIELMN